MALLHKDLKCKAPLIETNLRRNFGKWSTEFRKSVEDYYTCMNLIDKDRWNKDLIIKQHWMAASE